jgi:hypothetical protein
LKKEKIKKKEIYLLLLVSIVVLILPHLLRSNMSSFGYDSYYHIRSIESIKEEGINQKDNLFFGLRHFKISPLDILLSIFPNTIFLIRIIPFLTGIISIILYYEILKKLNPKKGLNLFAPFILLTSPIFIYSFSVYNEYFFSYFLILMGSYFFLNEKIMFSLIFFGLSPLFNPQCIIIVIIVLAILFKHFKEKTTFISFVIITLAFIFFLKETNNSYSLFDIPPTNEFISDFGAKIGFGVFSLLLAFCGLVLSWKNKKKYYLIYFIIFSTGLVSIRLDFLKLFVDMILIAFGSIALYKIKSLNWENKKLKEYTILLLICGLIFSSASQIKKISTDPPLANEQTALHWLNKNSDENSVIISHYKYGHMIQSIAKRTVIIDKLYHDTTKENIRLYNSTDLFNSRNFKKINKLINIYNITHFYITKEMKKGLVWKKEDEGILLILSNGERFKKIYDFEEIEIYKVKKIEKY